MIGPRQVGTRFWGPFRQIWLQPCSRHQRPSAECKICMAGYWRNAWALKLSQLFYWISPTLWRKWANRKR